MDIEERKYLCFQALIDCSFGTIWHIDEKFWAAHFQNYTSSRRWHPGFSILEGMEEGSFNPTLPLLFGTSCHSLRSFAVKGVTEAKGPEYRTWFGTIEKPIPRACIGDFFGRDPVICVNEDKPRATPSEIAEAEEFLKKNCCGRKPND